MKYPFIHHPSRTSVRCGAMVAAMSLAILPTVHSAEPSVPDSKPDKAPVAENKEKSQPYKITGGSSHPSNYGPNKLTVDQQGDTAIINVTSDYGMGSMSIQPQSVKWPKKIHIRLHLKGLEGFSVTKGVEKLHTLDLGDGPKFNAKAYDSKGKPFAGKYLMDENGHYEKGYYEVEVPAELFADKSAVLTIRWIDVYRD